MFSTFLWVIPICSEGLRTTGLEDKGQSHCDIQNSSQQGPCPSLPVHLPPGCVRALCCIILTSLPSPRRVILSCLLPLLRPLPRIEGFFSLLDSKEMFPVFQDLVPPLFPWLSFPQISKGCLLPGPGHTQGTYIVTEELFACPFSPPDCALWEIAEWGKKERIKQGQGDEIVFLLLWIIGTMLPYTSSDTCWENKTLLGFNECNEVVVIAFVVAVVVCNTINWTLAEVSCCCLILLSQWSSQVSFLFYRTLCD